jgi:3-oxoacyl-[acyl-carrier protein] reductase
VIFDLKGEVALVTGAGPNTGRGIVMALSKAGAALAVSDLNPEHADAGRDAVLGAGGRAISVPFDVTDADAVRAGVSNVRNQFGPITILVNNAGTIADPQPGFTGGQLGPFESSDPGIWRRWIDINLYGAMQCIHSALPDMTARGRGRIIQISSTSGSRGLAGGSVYGASKAGIEGFVRGLAMEVAPRGVTVNTLALGTMEMIGKIDNERTRAGLKRVPVGRRGQGREVGAAAVWLASDAGAWITGQTIHCNGGAFQGR